MQEINWARHYAFWEAKHPDPPPEPVVPEAPAIPPPVMVDVGLLAQPMNDTTDTIVALENAATSTIYAGDLVTIDTEVMIVSDATDQNNLTVTRGGPTAAHAVSTVVYVQR